MNDPRHLLEELSRALEEEDQARSKVRLALGRQAELLRQLRQLGVPTTRVAHRLLASGGVALPVADRLRLARRLRKRAERETARRPDLCRSHGRSLSATTPSDRALTPDQKESPMPKLVKRTVTEEFIEEPRDERDEDQEEDAEEEVDEADEPEATPARRHR